jgi:hypothetical protein
METVVDWVDIGPSVHGWALPSIIRRAVKDGSTRSVLTQRVWDTVLPATSKADMLIWFSSL